MYYLIQYFVIPVWINVRQLLANTVVLPEPQGVDGGQDQLLVHTDLACMKQNNILINANVIFHSYLSLRIM